MQTENLDYCAAVKSLFKQAFSLQRYKEMSKYAAVILAIITLPFTIATCILGALYMVAFVIFKFLKGPSEYLMSLLRTEGKDVKHATQFIIYFIGFPLVFLLNAIAAFIFFILFILFLLMGLITPIWTLGGVEFHPFLNDQIERKPLAPWANPSVNEFANLVAGVLCLTVAIGAFVAYGKMPNEILMTVGCSTITFMYVFLVFEKKSRVASNVASNKLNPIDKKSWKNIVVYALSAFMFVFMILVIFAIPLYSITTGRNGDFATSYFGLIQLMKNGPEGELDARLLQYLSGAMYAFDLNTWLITPLSLVIVMPCFVSVLLLAYPFIASAIKGQRSDANYMGLVLFLECIACITVTLDPILFVVALVAGNVNIGYDYIRCDAGVALLVIFAIIFIYSIVHYAVFMRNAIDNKIYETLGTPAVETADEAVIETSVGEAAVATKEEAKVETKEEDNFDDDEEIEIDD